MEAGEIVYTLAGSAVVDAGHPLARVFRDLFTAGAHVQNSPRYAERVGAFLLGSPTPLAAPSF